MPKYVMISIGICALISAWMFLGLGVSVFKAYQFVRDAKVARGVVKELHEEVAKKRRKDIYGQYEDVFKKSFYPVIEFKTESGKTILFRGSKGYNPPRYRVEDSVALLYKEGEKVQAKINSIDELWSDDIVTAVVGAVFLLLCFVIYYFASKKTLDFVV